MRDFSVRQLLAAGFILTATVASAQVQSGNSNKENDPYSRFGIGQITTGTNVLNCGMGYVSTAYQNASAINTDNPASYASLKLTTYEAGFTGSLLSIHTEDKTYGTGSANLANLRLGFPVGKHAGLALGLQPQSHIFYHNVDSNSINGIGKTASEYTGQGGLNYAFIGAAGETHGFSFGLNFGYLFGTMSNTSRLVNIDTTQVLGSDFSKDTRLGGLHFKAGIQYHDTLQNGWNIRLGATADWGQDLQGNQTSYSSSFYYVGTTITSDTAYTATGKDGKIVLPATYSIGANLGGLNWSVGVDATQMNWSKYRNFDAIDTNINSKTLRIGVGGEYTPDPLSVYSYISRITYRAGFYYGSDYVKLRNTDLNYYGLTVGASFPFKRSADRIHTALEFGRRGTTTNGLVQTNYFKVHLGISLNDRWFVKRRYD
ncbi:MAG: hypothetical protein ABI378_03950 [Chitinophagaceae bacterium]